MEVLDWAIEYVTILDEISQVDPSIGFSVAAHNSLCTNHIYEFGNEEQRKKMVTKISEWSSHLELGV